MSRLLALLLLLPLSAAASPLEITAGGGFSTRRFFWVDPISPTLRPYRAAAFPVLTLAADLTGPGDPRLGDLGLSASFASSVGLSSREAGGPELGTVFRRLDVTPRLRLWPWGRGGARLSLLAGVGSTSFEMEAPPWSDLPSFSYIHGRLGGELRVPLGPASVLVSGSFLPVLSSGQLAARFRRHEARGMDGTFGAALPLGGRFEARALFTYAHFAHSMEPLPGEDHVAGGALDQYLGAQVSLVVAP